MCDVLINTVILSMLANLHKARKEVIAKLQILQTLVQSLRVVEGDILSQDPWAVNYVPHVGQGWNEHIYLSCKKAEGDF